MPMGRALSRTCRLIVADIVDSTPWRFAHGVFAKSRLEWSGCTHHKSSRSGDHFMTIIDAQLHAYERNHPGRPWHAVLTGPDEATGDQTVAVLDAAGVDGAILVSAFTMYRYDASYALEVKKRHPGRFAVIKPVDPADPAVADIIAEWKRTPGTVGIRMLLIRARLAADPADPDLNRVLATAARLSVPVNLHIAGRLDQGTELIRRNPDTQIIVDHLGLVQPHEPPKPAEPWAELPKVLELAALPNVAVQITGGCTLWAAPFAR